MIRIFKSKILLIITTMKKEEEDNRIVYRVKTKEYANISGHSLEKSLEEDKAKGLKREVQLVMEEPKEFVFGVLYVLYGGKKAWIYNLEG